MCISLSATKTFVFLVLCMLSVELGASEKKKPETVEFNNKTKCGVDVTDQTARQYLVKAGTRRWPVAVFYNI